MRSRRGGKHDDDLWAGSRAVIALAVISLLVMFGVLLLAEQSGR